MQLYVTPTTEDALTRNVAAAAASGDAAAWGRAEVALGVSFHHRGRHAEARPLLESGLDHLPAADPAADQARAHLDAFAEGWPCGCGRPREDLAGQLRQHILSHFPDGLLRDVRIELPEGRDALISVDLSREPTQAELERVGVLVNRAYVALRAHDLNRR